MFLTKEGGPIHPHEWQDSALKKIICYIVYTILINVKQPFDYLQQQIIYGFLLA